MDLTVIILFVGVFLLSFIYLKKPRKLPPGYFGIPFIGSLSLMRKLTTDRPHIVLYDESKRLGKIFCFYIGEQLIVVLSGYDVIRETIVKNAESFSDRFTFAKNSALPSTIVDKGIVFNEYGPVWKELRRFTLQALRDFGVGKASIEEKIQVEIEASTSYLQETKGKPTSMNDLMQKLVANIIFSIIFGKRYDYDDTEFDEARKMTNRIISGQGPLSLTHFLPTFIVKLLHRQGNENFKIRQQSVLDVMNYISKQITEHEATFDADNIRDFVDIFIKTEREGDESIRKYITKGAMFRVIIDLFLAGSESTSTTLDWAFLYMIEYPEVQKKCREEIEQVCGNKMIQFSDRSKLVYVNAALMEIQRCANIVPLNVPHATLKDSTIYGYDIPARTIVIPMLYSVSMDEKYFPNPEKFDPNRFISETGTLIKNEAWIPFSAGPRMCLGEPLARMELFLVFANMLQRFEFCRENSSRRHTMESKQAQTTNAPVSYKLRAIRRQ